MRRPGSYGDGGSDVCSSDLVAAQAPSRSRRPSRSVDRDPSPIETGVESEKGLVPRRVVHADELLADEDRVWQNDAALRSEERRLGTEKRSRRAQRQSNTYHR